MLWIHLDAFLTSSTGKEPHPGTHDASVCTKLVLITGVL